MSNVMEWFEGGWEEEDTPDKPLLEGDEPATPENIMQFMSAFCGLIRLDTGRWQPFRSSYLNFALEEAREWPDNEVPTLEDLGPKLWGFYSGYMACERAANKLIMEVKK